MKKKLLVFTLCFTLIFSSLNFKKSYAIGGSLSVPLVATISALAVGSGIVINSNDDIYDIGKLFYDYIDKRNDLTLETVNAVFLAGSSVIGNKVSVDSKFLDIVKGFFDTTFSTNSDIKYLGTVPFYPTYSPINVKSDTIFSFDDMSISILWSNSYYKVMYRKVGSSATQVTLIDSATTDVAFLIESNAIKTYWIKSDGTKSNNRSTVSHSLPLTPSLDFPYNGGYTWDNVESKKENDSVSLPVPSDVGTLVGQTSNDFWNNTNDLIVGGGDIVLPGVDSPSIDVIPGVIPGVGSSSPSVPGDSIWSQIRDFIISLVVPNDTFWTDTWGGLYNNFTSSFPMVDMDGFNDLVTGEKKFPNIDINIMGVTGRVVNGDVINSIVDWLRPIVAGFMMLCLMLFNYRKIYKLIRNSEPFGSVASGNNSDIKTGISEYSKHEVVKATDMVAEYHAWRERGGK